MAEAKETAADKVERAIIKAQVPTTFASNPGINGEIFTDKNSYTDRVCKTQEGGEKELEKVSAEVYKANGYTIIEGPNGNFAAIHPSKYKQAQKNIDEKTIWDREEGAIKQLVDLGYTILSEKDSKVPGVHNPDVYLLPSKECADIKHLTNAKNVIGATKDHLLSANKQLVNEVFLFIRPNDDIKEVNIGIKQYLAEFINKEAKPTMKINIIQKGKLV